VRASLSVVPSGWLSTYRVARPSLEIAASSMIPMVPTTVLISPRPVNCSIVLVVAHQDRKKGRSTCLRPLPRHAPLGHLEPKSTAPTGGCGPEPGARIACRRTRRRRSRLPRAGMRRAQRISNTHPARARTRLRRRRGAGIVVCSRVVRRLPLRRRALSGAKRERGSFEPSIAHHGCAAIPARGRDTKQAIGAWKYLRAVPTARAIRRRSTAARAEVTRLRSGAEVSAHL
jgi:hypothetical protein